MNNAKHTIILVLLALLCAGGCVREPQLDGSTTEEGLETKITLGFKTSNMNAVSRSLTQAEEEKIKSIFIFIFDKNGILVNSAEHANFEAHDPQGINEISIPAITGNGRTIYAIANYDSNIIEGIKSVTLEEDIQQLVVSSIANPLKREYGMTKVGVEHNVAIRPQGRVVVELQYISTKVTVNIINKCTDLVVDGWSTDGFPMKTYLNRRDVSPSDPNYHDAADLNNSNDYYYDFTEQSFHFDIEPNTPGYGDPTNQKEYSTTFYTFENRRGVKLPSEKSPIPDGWPHGIPDGQLDNRDPYQTKSWEAPANATRIRILGQHKKNPASPKAFIINHYLGADNVSDYNVERATHYTYTITINGLNSIDIDTNIEQFDDKLSVRPPADLMNLDSHASSLMFLVYSNLISDGKVDVQVLNSVNSVDGDYADWLKLSIFPIIMHQARSNAPKISRWQQDGAIGSMVRTKFIPHKSIRAKLAATSTPYTMPSGLSLVGGMNEAPDLNVENPDMPGNTAVQYPANDDMLPYYWAARRMCYRITDLPTYTDLSSIGAAADPTKIFVCADEFEYDNAPMAQQYREAVVRITYTPNNGTTPEYKHFTVRQYRPNKLSGLPKDTNIMVAERVEEYAHMMQTILPTELQLTAGMQWGKYLAAGASKSDGYRNTVEGVYTNVTVGDAAGKFGWSTYQPKYGSMAGGWNVADDGLIVEPQTGGQPEGAPFFEFNFNNNNYYNLIYNSSAARYCHEKNFDINGDGELSFEETKWYLPSLQELQLFWTYQEALNLTPEYYWSSSRLDNDKAYAISMQKSIADPHLNYNGTPQPIIKTINSVNPPRVRCVRRVNGTPLHPIVKRLSSEIDCSSLPGDMYTTVSKVGIIQQNLGGIQKANMKVFKKFEVQSKENILVNYVGLHKGEGLCNERLGWRLPTQREMLLIYSVRSLLKENPNFKDFADGEYWTMTKDVAKHYYIDFSTGLSGLEDRSSQSKSMYYRCIREIQ